MTSPLTLKKAFREVSSIVVRPEREILANSVTNMKRVYEFGRNYRPFYDGWY